MTRNKGIKVFLSGLMSCLILFSLCGSALALGSLKDEATWREIADQISPFTDSDDLARRLSGFGAAQKTKDASGVSYYTVIVQSGSSGTMYFVNKTVRTFSGSGPESDPATNSKYDPVTISGYETPSGGTAEATVYVFRDAADADLQRVSASISSALLSQAGVTPDTGTAMGLLNGVMPLVNTLLGLIVAVISIGMTVFSALDIIYLAFPAFRGKVDAAVEGGHSGSGWAVKQNRDGSVSSRWVSDDARSAIKEAGEQQQPWGIYFKRRIVAYVFLAVILFVLLTGNIFSITTLVTNALSGLFDALGLA
jgi:hypothetical protein